MKAKLVPPTTFSDLCSTNPFPLQGEGSVSSEGPQRLDSCQQRSLCGFQEDLCLCPSSLPFHSVPLDPSHMSSLSTYFVLNASPGSGHTEINSIQSMGKACSALCTISGLDSRERTPFPSLPSEHATERQSFSSKAVFIISLSSRSVL